MDKSSEIKLNRRFVLQLHITGRCNQRCKHCYHIEYTNEPLTFENIQEVIKQYVDLLEKYNENLKNHYKGHIHITGGEPLVRKDFMKIVQLMHANRDKFTFNVLTNGSLITDEIASKLYDFGVGYVQVSIDGDYENHDLIRGKGNLERTLKSIDILNKYGIRTMVSFTAGTHNYKDFPKVAKYCSEHGVSVLWSDRVVPFGNADTNQCMSTEECMEFFRIMQDEKVKKVKEGSALSIQMERSLQFIVSKQLIYHCYAGESQIVVDENGNVMPCRRLPLVCGNILEDNLINIFYNNKIMQDLRKNEIPIECIRCRFKKTCNGGARCISYAKTKNFNEADPYCPLIFYGKNDNEEGLCLQ